MSYTPGPPTPKTDEFTKTHTDWSDAVEFMERLERECAGQAEMKESQFEAQLCALPSLRGMITERQEMLRRIGANETAQLLTQAVQKQCEETARVTKERDEAIGEVVALRLLRDQRLESMTAERHQLQSDIHEIRRQHQSEADEWKTDDEVTSERDAAIVRSAAVIRAARNLMARIDRDGGHAQGTDVVADCLRCEDLVVKMRAHMDAADELIERIRFTAALHYVGQAFNPEHMRGIANACIQLQNSAPQDIEDWPTPLVIKDLSAECDHLRCVVVGVKVERDEALGRLAALADPNAPKTWNEMIDHIVRLTAERDQFKNVEIPMLQKWIQNLERERDEARKRTAPKTLDELEAVNLRSIVADQNEDITRLTAERDDLVDRIKQLPHE